MDARQTSTTHRRRLLVRTMVTLATGALGFVVALAWHDAISTTIEAVLKKEYELAGLYAYAILATAIAVALVLALVSQAARVGVEAD